MDSQTVLAMLEACTSGNMEVIKAIVSQDAMFACQQDNVSGKSPLMMAAFVGNLELCEFLLELGAPWNAVDRNGQCAGNYATDAEHWHVVNLLVDAATRAELILGASIRYQRQQQQQNELVQDNHRMDTNDSQLDGKTMNDEEQKHSKVVEHEPCTKPDYLRHRLTYNADGTALLDKDLDAVMMAWERPLMEAHASILLETPGKRVMNVGFGMGIIDTALQKLNPSLHIIIEAHPDVYQRMLDDKWDQKPNVRLCYGTWQDVIPRLVDEGVVVDGIFYDTYGEHFLDLEDFHALMVRMLSKPHGIYSFFNGLAPDNLFFHGVACQCVKLQLGHLGLDTEFLPCEIQVKDSVWEGIRRKYWHGRDTYYLPRATWQAAPIVDDGMEAIDETRKSKASSEMEIEQDAKRHKVGP